MEHEGEGRIETLNEPHMNADETNMQISHNRPDRKIICLYLRAPVAKIEVESVLL